MVEVRVFGFKKSIIGHKVCIVIFLALKIDSSANLVAFYKYISMYIFDGPKIGAETKIRVKTQEKVNVKVEILLSLIIAFLASSLLLTKRKL